MTKFKFFMLLCVAVALNSCNSTTKAVYWVNSIKVNCDAGAGKMQCLQVYKGDDLSKAEWEAFYAPIDGFTFEEGFFKKIEVSEKPLQNVPADASSIVYTLVREIEKTPDPRFALQGDWILLKLGEMELAPDARPLLKLNVSEMRVNGSDSCNTIMGDIKTLTDKQLIFGDLASTMMYCEEKMKVADAFGIAMKKVAQYQIKDNQLSLSDTEGNILLSFISAKNIK